MTIPPEVHDLIDYEVAVAWDDGYARGYAEGLRAARVAEREAVREALWPSAPSLKAAVGAHLRAMAAREARRA